jgi:hypothetical protein
LVRADSAAPTAIINVLGRIRAAARGALCKPVGGTTKNTLATHAIMVRLACSVAITAMKPVCGRIGACTVTNDVRSGAAALPSNATLESATFVAFATIRDAVLKVHTAQAAGVWALRWAAALAA